MSSDNSSVTSLKQRLKRWMLSDCDEAYLGTESKDELRRKLREWIDKRFRNYADIKALRITCHQRAQTVIERMRNNQPAPRDVVVRDLYEGILRSERAEALDAEQTFQNLEAAFLCQTLKTKHGVHWEDLREQPHTPCDHHVVGALMALGQEDISMQTLIELEDVEDEERLRESRRQQDVEIDEQIGSRNRDYPRGYWQGGRRAATNYDQLPLGLRCDGEGLLT